MSRVDCQITVSLDGFVAGPNPSLEEPLGEGGERLHEWVVATRSWRAQHGHEGGVTGPDDDVARANIEGVGAYVMGRGMFGGGDGGWDESWHGWWGEEPPFHAPVFVLTHHPREPLELEGTTFTFVTEGVESAVEQARRAAGEQRVVVAGGASAVQQALAAGLLDELQLHIAPVLLGGGRRLLENLGEVQLEQTEVLASPAVTHVTYRVANAASQRASEQK